MGYSSQAGHLGLKTQAIKGTYLDPGATAPNQGVFMRTKSGSLGGDRELIIPDPEIGGNRDIPDALLGPIKFSGSFDFYARMESLALLLKGVSGANVTSGSALLGYTHTINTANALPWISIEENIAGGYMIFKYTDCIINSLHLEADADNYLQGTAEIIGLTQATTTETPIGNRRYDTSPLLVGTNITVAYNGASLPAKSFSIDINNNVEDDDFRMGSLFLGDLVPKRREVTMGVTIRPQDANLWKLATWGSAAAVAPTGQTTKDDVVVTINSYEDIPGATAPQPYVATFTFPQVIIEPYTPEPSGDDVLEHDLSMRAVRPNPAVDIYTATVKNSFATVP
jgi:hypothetical protein